LTYDVIIIGGGPSGSLLAFLLSKKGYSNLILEKEKLPRYKACGGGLTMKSINLLPFDVSPVIENAAKGGILTYQGNELFRVDHKNVVAKYIMRDVFDNYLIKMALNEGTEIIDAVNIKNIELNNKESSINTSNGLFKSKILIGADGVYSLVAKYFGLQQNRRTGIALETEISIPEKALKQQGSYALFDFGAIEHGYGWIFPKQSHVSAGIFYANHNNINNLKIYLEKFIANHHILKDHNIINIKGHKIPLGGNATQLHTEHGLLIGDAANLADPWLGEGIYYALRSATIAAEEIDLYLKLHGYTFSNYTKRINEEIVKQLKHASILSKLVYRYPFGLSKILSHSTIMQKGIFDTMRGDIGFKDLEIQLIKNIPNIIKEVFTKRKSNELQ